MRLKDFKKKYPTSKPIVLCDRCNNWCYGYYTLSLLTKGLYVLCPDHHHARPFIENLDVPHIPSKHYLKHTNVQIADTATAVT